MNLSFVICLRIVKLDIIFKTDTPMWTKKIYGRSLEEKVFEHARTKEEYEKTIHSEIRRILDEHQG